MVHRFSVLLGSGVVTAGLSAAALAGAGLALAEDGTSAAAGTGGTSSTSQSDDAAADRVTRSPRTPRSAGTPGRAETSRGADASAETGGSDHDDGPDLDADLDADDEAELDVDLDPDDGSADEPPAEEDATTVETDAEAAVEEPEVLPAAVEDTTKSAGMPDTVPDAAPATHSTYRAGVAQEFAEADEASPAALTPTTFAAAAPQPAATQQPTLLNIVGTVVFRVLEAVITLFDGPPAVPPGSTVTPARSALDIDCGDGYTVEADWYFPEDPNPQRLIYFQHGWPARASFYNATAAELAERNNAIVVAPSISGNLFACDGCFSGGDAMHAAVGELFLGDREALLASARLASGNEELVLPQQFVLAGHSGGGLLAAGAGGFYTQYAPDERDRDLVGVLLLDTTAVGGQVSRAVDKIPEDIPVYTISAEPAQLNSFGSLNEALVAARPDQFVGVELVGGRHSDAYRTLNPVAQFVVSLMTGFSQPQNVEAVQVLAEGWIDDWFEGTHTAAYYGPLGSTIDISTDAGTAQARVLPTAAVQLNVIERILKFFSDSQAGLKFDYCAEDPDTRNSSETTALNRTSGACSHSDA